MVRGGGAGEDELPLLCRLIHFIAHRVPKRWYFLPLVDQPGRLSLQHQSRRQLRQLTVLKVAGRVTNIDLTLAVIGGSPGLAAPFRPLHADGTEGGQVFFHLMIDNAGLIDLFVHGSHLNDSVKSLYSIQLNLTTPFSQIFNFECAQFILLGQG